MRYIPGEERPFLCREPLTNFIGELCSDTVPLMDSRTQTTKPPTTIKLSSRWEQSAGEQIPTVYWLSPQSHEVTSPTVPEDGLNLRYQVQG